jgi:DNA-binding response OmpR family regulator
MNDLPFPMKALMEPRPIASDVSERFPMTSQNRAKIIKRVLVADDDPMVRSALAAVLESEGYAADQVHNGVEAVNRAMEQLPDLVLLDLNMPHLDGWQTFAQLDHVAPLLPVIVITPRPHQYQEAVRLGVDAFMEKPLHISVLLRAIKRLVGETPEQRVIRITNRAFVTRLLSSAPKRRKLAP